LEKAPNRESSLSLNMAGGAAWFVRSKKNYVAAMIIFWFSIE